MIMVEGLRNVVPERIYLLRRPEVPGAGGCEVTVVD